MSAPRLEVNLDHLRENTQVLVDRLGRRGIRVSGVTKAMLGVPQLARAFIDGGARSLADSRIENIEAMRAAGITAPMTLIRSPMLSQCDRVVAGADASLNSEADVITALAAAARRQGRVHGVVLMVELGDLREGILPHDLEAAARHVLAQTGVRLSGIGANLACQSGVAPSVRNMTELSALAAGLEHSLGVTLNVVSGGNSANLTWALNAADLGRVNELRLGEAILLGRETLQRRPIPGLHTDAFTLVGEVIEAKHKPSRPWGDITQNAFGERPPLVDRGVRARVIVAVGRQDTDHTGLTAPEGYDILGASSDHLVLDAEIGLPAIGSEVRFGLNYAALLRAMTSPYVTPQFVRDGMDSPVALPTGQASAATAFPT